MKVSRSGVSARGTGGETIREQPAEFENPREAGSKGVRCSLKKWFDRSAKN
jgi:hypothetical protein